MPKIHIAENHSLSRDEIISRVGDYLDYLRDKKLKAMGFGYTWNGDKTGLTINGKGFKGSGSLSDSHVTLTLDLSLMLSPFKGSVEESLKRGLKRVVTG